jgi:ATP-dependent helicase/nuclease subunit B
LRTHLPDRSLFLASSNEELRKRAEALLGKGETILLASTRAAADDFLRSSTRPGFLGVHAFTLPQLAARLASQSGGAFTPLSQLSQEALVARVVFSLRNDERLRYFHPVADRPGFIRALAATLGELRLEGVDPRELSKTGDAGRDISLLTREYARQLTEARLADLALLYEKAIDVIRERPHPLIGLPLVLLDVPIRFTREKQFLRELVSRSPGAAAVCLAADELSVDALQKCLGTLPAFEPEKGGTTSARVRRFLFSTQLQPGPDIDDTLSYFSSPGEGLECVEIARRIHTLARAGVPFDRIGVLLRSPERYQPLLEEAFRRACIPACFTRGSSRPDPAGRAFLALLVCAAERCSASRFSEYLSLAQVPELNAHGEPQRRESDWTPPSDEMLAALLGSDPAASAAPEPEPAPGFAAPMSWERLLVDAAVVGGVERWQRRLSGLMSELRTRLTECDEDEIAREQLERRIERLEALQHFALPVIGLLAALPGKAKWSEWLDKLVELAETSLRHPEPVTAALSELRLMEEIGPVSLDEVYCVLEDRLRFLRRDPPHYRYGRVLVSTIEAARAHCFDVVFLPGLAEGIFPRRASEDPLLLDASRRQISNLTLQEDRVARERLLLHIAAAAGAKLVISYPRVDVAQSRSRVPSFYAIEILRAAEGRLPDVRAFEKRAEAATSARLGWPAPSDPSQAIDDAEFVLASLDRFHRLSAEDRHGRARYLIQVSPVLARSLRSRWQRWHTKWSSVDGLLDKAPEVLAILQKHRLRQRSFSPTSLQLFAACPYRFALHVLHSLNPREAAVALEHLDPLTRGALFHKVQNRLFGALREADLLPVTGSRLGQALDLADKVLDEVAAEEAELLAPAIPRVWATEIEELRLDMRGFLRHTAITSPHWTPIRSELQFGLNAEPAAAILDGFLVRGSVDLVEERGDSIRVTDFKTGSPPAGELAYVGGGKVLQPLLYALAVENLLGRPVESGRLYYSTHRGGYHEIEIPTSAAARAHLATVLSTIDQALENGSLPVAPAEHACDFCDYRSVCGPHEELRVSRKSRQLLQPLIELRRLG